MATAPERAADYHADRGLWLSQSLARPLLYRSPAHAKAILDGLVQYDSDAMTIGTAVHQVLLRDDRIDILRYDSYRSKDAQAERDLSRSVGRVPILQAKWDEARQIAEHVNGQILNTNYQPTPFTNGSAECPIRFTMNDAECRCLIDWLRDDRTHIDDLKTTGDASPSKFRRHVFNMGYDIQAAFYTRAVEHAYGVTPTFRFVVVETKPPYPVVVYQLSPRALASAMVKVDAACQIWNECIRSGEWPAYTTHPVEVDIPGWVSDEADAWGEVDLEEVPF